MKSYASMFLNSAHQAGRYQGTLLKAVKDQVFQPEHKPEAYYLAAFTYYRFEVALRKLPADDKIMRSFKFFLLSAFRYRYENGDFPGAGNRKLPIYCDHLAANLVDQDKVKAAFDECVSIVTSALENLNLPVERDSAKSRPLLDEVQKIAKELNQSDRSLNS